MTQVPAEAVVVGGPSLEEAEEREGPSLKSATTRAAAWAVIGYGGSYVLRFLSTVIVTKLVAPELLGLTVVAMTALEGLNMFTDIGIQQSVIRHPRGDEPAFYNTAWTLGVIRGIVLALGTAALAVPISLVYDQPKYLELIPAVGVGALVTGLGSPSMFLLKRHLALGKVVAIELASSSLGTAVTIGVAWATASMWAVPIGYLTTCSALTACSLGAMKGIRLRFALEREAAWAIVHFGKWLFFSAVVMFISRSADKFSLAKLMPSALGHNEGMKQLQVYNTALLLSEVAATLGTQITYNVLFPAYSRVLPQGVDRLRDVYYRSRLRLDLFCVMGTGFVASAAPWIVDLLYDQRYTDAKWILRALSVRAAMMCMLVPCENVLFSMGYSHYSFWRNLARAVWVLIGVPIGWANWGLPGAVGAMAMTEVPVLLVLWPAAMKHRVFSWLGEARSVAIFVVGVGLGWVFLRYMPSIQLGPIIHQIAHALHLAKNP